MTLMMAIEDDIDDGHDGNGAYENIWMEITVIVKVIVDMTVGMMEAVILRSMTSTTKLQRKTMHAFLELVLADLLYIVCSLLKFILEKVFGIGKQCLCQSTTDYQVRFTLHNLTVIL
jgi:hypothetical protein